MKNLKVIKIDSDSIKFENGIGAKSHKHISCCCKGTEKTAQGFKWEYKHG